MKNFNNLKKEKVAEVDSGGIINEIPALFERASAYSYGCKSYCTLAKINYSDFRYVMQNYKEIQQQMIEKLYDNPYDIDRNYFVMQMSEYVHYMKSLSDSSIKHLYYDSDIQLYD